MHIINLFGTIGEEVTADSVRRQLEIVGAVPVTVAINSPGGSVMEGIAIHELLRQRQAPTTVEIVGWALSIASVIAMAGKTIRIAPAGLLMVHNPWTNATGNAAELRKTAETLDTVRKTLVRAYARTGASEATISAWLDAETWFDADQALAAGLVDEVIGERADELAGFNACAFKIPNHLKERIHAMNTVVQKETEIRDQVLAADQARRTAIQSSFRKFAGIDGVAQLMQDCLNDYTCTERQANEKLLAQLGHDSFPIAGRYVAHVRGDENRAGEFKAAAVDCLLGRANIPVAEPHPMVRDLQRLSIVGIAERILSMHGISSAEKSKSAIIQAAMTTGDFPELLSATAGKALRLGYELAPATHAVWTAEREVADFKPQSLLSLSEAPSLEKVAEASEYHYGAFSEAVENFSLATYGKIVSISRQALVNDDLGAFTRIPQAYGASARRIEADLVYGKLIGNPALKDGKALFHADHGNLAASGTALSVTTLGAARAAMRKQKGIAGKDYIDPQPRFLLVPVALETLAEQLLASLVDPSKTNDTGNPEWIRRLTLVADPRLDEASQTAWYLAADPHQLETIVRAYLAGEPRPFLDENVGFERDVVSHKCRLDVAAAAIDFRGLYKNPGAAS